MNDWGAILMKGTPILVVEGGMMKTNRKTLRLLTYVFPALAVLVFVILIPSVVALFYGFTDYSPGREVSFIGLDNYISLLTNSRFWMAVLNNVYYLVGCLVAELFLGFSCALLLNKRFRFQPLWFCLLLAPYAESPVVAVQIWKYLLDPTYGWINYGLTKLGFEPVIWFSTKLTSMIPVCLVSVWKEFPFLMITIYAALTTVPTEVEEAAKIDGARSFNYFFRVLLPIISPAVLVGLVFRIIFLIRSFEIVWVFTGGGPGTSTEILAINMYKESFLYYNFGRGSALGWILLGITFAASYKLIKNANKSLLQ